jgi:hypothetical protein
VADVPMVPDGEATASEGKDEDSLDVAESGLLRSSLKIGDPTAQDSHARLYACLFGHRATSLYANFLHSLSSPAAIAPILALRPLVEAVIVSKWISLDPTLHGELWFAQAEDREITTIREQERHLGLRVDIPDAPGFQTVEQKMQWRDEAIAHGKDAGKRYGDRPMPPLDRLVMDIEAADPDHRIAMRQAYDVVYRTFSPWMHTEASSFKATAVATPDGLSYLGDRSPYRVDHLRVIAGAMFAYALEIVGVAVGDGSEVMARFIRDYLTIVHFATREPGVDSESDGLCTSSDEAP